MWEVEQGGSGFEVSTDAAIEAAKYVFDHAELKGCTKPEIETLLLIGKRSPSYGYAAPFYPPKKNAQVYRFDNGHSGWQFEVVFDGKDICQEVIKRGIE